MRRWGFVVLALAVACATLAQAPSEPWSLELMSGANTASGELDGGWVNSAALRYSFSDRWSLRTDLEWSEGALRHAAGSKDIWTVLAGPEYRWMFGDRDEVYAFAGLGSAHRGSVSGLLEGGTAFRMDGETKFAGQAGLGYRHFFTKRLGLSLQAAYTHMAFRDSVDTGDARVGLLFRF